MQGPGDLLYMMFELGGWKVNADRPVCLEIFIELFSFRLMFDIAYIVLVISEFR